MKKKTTKNRGIDGRRMDVSMPMYNVSFIWDGVAMCSCGLDGIELEAQGTLP